ncbi:hypothetical protein F0562_013417 [Nyssa sinensis]|uniref:Calmodulin-binding domain-containing protein n=1 Tax=Nyssa sinensis TaxID=561372 RepID=A0A5J4ZQ34_9ASTE|nr:hypothetical protein F0562_013417 [Nyssa sinensis]
MVQRKVPNKLGIQADHVKSEKQLGNLKPSFYQNQDGKNRGTDLKKKMKKSRSFKRSDFESLISPTLGQGVPQPGKPPPPPPVDVPATPQKQSPIKASYGSPNYMKSTSSSDARKERTQVSSQNFRTGTRSKSPRTNNYSDNSKLSSASGNKMGRTLTRTSSLKLARTLTKSPSFKPVRAMVTKCSQVALSENLIVQRATCSSTLKYSKFPSYLTLNPGGTESEGTSVMKVCPYTYCSLNGHHHPPLPPLKCFLSARRRILKTQKSVKLGCLSPRRVKPSSDRMQEIDNRQVAVDEKPAIQEPDLNCSAVNPLIQESMDFFIEIYVNNMEDTTDTIGKCKHNADDQDTPDFSVNDIMPSIGGCDDSAAEQVVENLSDEPLHSEIDFEDNQDQNSNVISTETDNAEFFPDVGQKVEGAKEVYPPSSSQQETALQCLSYQRNSEVESPADIELDEPDVVASDMKWEKGPYSASYLDDEIDNSIQINRKSYLERGYSLEADNPSCRDKPIFKSDDIVSSCLNENQTNEVMQEFYEESVCFDSMFADSDSESDGSYQNLESDESVQLFDHRSHGQLSPTHDASEELTITEERDGKVGLDDSVGTAMTLAPITDSTEQPTAADEEKNGASEADNETPGINLQVGDDKTEHTSKIEDEALADHQENEHLQDNDATALQVNQQSDPSPDFTGQDRDKTYKDYTASLDIIEVEQSDAAIEKGRFSVEVFDESILPRTEDSDTDPSFLEQEPPIANAGDGMEVEEDQVDAAKLSVQATFDLLQGFSEADQDTTNEDNDESQTDAIAKDSKSNQTFADEGLSADSQDHSSDKQSQSNKVVENQNQSEEDRDAAEKFKILNSQDHTHSGINKFRLEENRNQDVKMEMEVEERTKPDAEETCPIAKNVAGAETKNAFLRAGSDSNLELPKTCSHPRGTIRFRRPIEDWEEPRKFNPREPNYLPEQPDPEAEKVDLKHQTMDERKNAEEWMLDYAVQQAVSKLAPARKKKVALLVEAFETVMPIPKFETRPRHASAAFAHARPIQACN